MLSKIFRWLHLYPKPQVKGKNTTNRYIYLRKKNRTTKKFIKVKSKKKKRKLYTRIIKIICFCLGKSSHTVENLTKCKNVLYICTQVSSRKCRFSANGTRLAGKTWTLLNPILSPTCYVVSSLYQSFWNISYFLLNLSLSDIITASIFDLLLLFCFSTIKNHKTEIYVLKFQHGHRIKLYKKTKL